MWFAILPERVLLVQKNVLLFVNEYISCIQAYVFVWQEGVFSWLQQSFGKAPVALHNTQTLGICKDNHNIRHEQRALVWI